MYEAKPFDQEDHEKFLKHEDIKNLSGLEIDLVYEWELGSMLIFIELDFIVHHQILMVKKLPYYFYKKIIYYGNL